MLAEENRMMSIPCDIVTDETEPCDTRVGLHDPSQSRLSILSHGIRFVQDDEFVRWTGVCLAISTRWCKDTDPNRRSGEGGKRQRHISAKSDEGGSTYVDTPTCLGVSLAKLLIFSLTTEIPLSSEALSSSTRPRKRSGLKCPSSAQTIIGLRFVGWLGRTRRAVVLGRGSYLLDSATS